MSQPNEPFMADTAGPREDDISELHPAEPSGFPEEMIAADEAVEPVVESAGDAQEELRQAQAKAEENWKLYLSLRAEMDNLRKRLERDLQNARKYALKEFVDALLPVKDSLEMGVAAASEAVDVDKLREGSELTLKMLTGALEKQGVREINPLGEKFNPDLHAAMAMQPSDQAEPNTVLIVVQKGYLLNDRLVRPAMVIVARAPG